MVPPESQPHHHHGHGHPQGHSHHVHGHVHSHGLASPHPAQVATWSILRMPVVSRLGAALVVSAALWAVVLLAMR
jgi:H+/gluconate symporter-like permease